MNVPHQEPSLQWYAIHTHARQEDRAESNLRAWNVETFAPRCKSLRRNQFRKEPSYFIKPLFSRYIFARFDAREMLSKIRYTRGVHSIVSVGETPAIIDSELIDLIMSRRDSAGLVRLEEEMQPGDEVLVNDGPFSGFVGVFERRMKDSERVAILLKTVTYKIRVIVPGASVAKLDGRELTTAPSH
jgi:transcriptional antiterminator RfaH